MSLKVRLLTSSIPPTLQNPHEQLTWQDPEEDFDSSITSFESAPTWREKHPILSKIASAISSIFLSFLSLFASKNNTSQRTTAPTVQQPTDDDIEPAETLSPQDERIINDIRRNILPIQQRATSIYHTSKELQKGIEKNNEQLEFPDTREIDTLNVFTRHTEHLIDICDKLDRACTERQWTAMGNLIKKLVAHPQIDKSLLERLVNRDAVSSLEDDLVLLEHFRKINFQK